MGSQMFAYDTTLVKYVGLLLLFVWCTIWCAYELTRPQDGRKRVSNLLHLAMAVRDAAHGLRMDLAEAHRLLRPGGTAILVDATGEKLAPGQMLTSMWRFIRRWGLVREKGQQDLTQAG